MRVAFDCNTPSRNADVTAEDRRSPATLLLLAMFFIASTLLPLHPLMAADDPKPAEDAYFNRLYIADSDGSNMRRMADLPDLKAQGSPEWSQDGKLIVFDGRAKMGQGIGPTQIYSINADGTNFRHLIDGNMPSLSPEGNRIAFSREGGVWVMSTEGPDKELVQIDATGWGTNWSPDGRIVYSTHAEGGANLVVFNLVEGKREALFDEAKSPYTRIGWNFVWSPDSKRIVFQGTKRDGKIEVGIVDARGEKFGLVHRHEGEIIQGFSWVSTQPKILMAKLCRERGKLVQLYLLDPDTNDPPTFLPAQAEDRTHLDFCYSPDGMKIAISSRPPVVPMPPAVEKKAAEKAAAAK